MTLTPRCGLRIAVGSALACSAILFPAAALAASSAPGMPATAASWKIVKTVRGKDSPDFSAVTATGRHSAWAFEATSSEPAAWELSGSSWTRVPFPGKAGERVTSAASTSPDDVWAVAGSRVLSWNGRSWAVTGSFPGSGGDVVPLSLRDAWFFDGGQPGGGAWHWNGRRWSRAPKSDGLSDGSALSPGSIWAIGTTHVAHWNGHSWSRTSVAGLLPHKTFLSGPGLTGIYAQSPKSVWAVGAGHRETIGGPDVVLHFNGHRWSRVALTDAARDPVAGQVIPDGKGGLWIPTVGFEGRAPSRMLHYSGGQLGFAALPAVNGRVLYVEDETAVPGTRRVIGCGTGYSKTAPQNAVILTYGS
jgi:hypothetical protein